MDIKTQEVKHHHVGIMSDKIRIGKSLEVAHQRAGSGSGSAFYFIHDGWQNTNLKFQQGNPAEKINGITDESLLSVVLDRLIDTQNSDYATQENAEAIEHILAALAAMHTRTKTRIERGVEGTTTV